MMNVTRLLQLPLFIKIVTAAFILIVIALFVSYQRKLAADSQPFRKAQQRAAAEAAIRNQMIQLPAESFQKSPVWGSPTP
jgi:hypothetical protein